MVLKNQADAKATLRNKYTGSYYRSGILATPASTKMQENGGLEVLRAINEPTAA